MSYLVLARKYRPRDFEALVGQEHVVQALANALTQQRLHHAYLFTGTRGVGKTTVSRILAKSLNCTGPDGAGGITAHPCGVCPACRDIDTGRFVDYVELDAASNRGVEEISQLLDQSVYKPVVGRFKVYMIDEVHMLSSHAFNAMLKTLEEPPEYLKFVLATTDPQKLPPTVLSRCLQFNLRPMAPQTVHEHLTAVLAEENIPADVGSLRLLSRAARGSMRDALSLTDQAIAFGSGRLEEATVRQMLGAVDRTHAVRILDALAAGAGADLVAAVDGLRSLGLSATGTLEELAALLQQMAVVRVVPDAVDEADPDTAAVRRLGSLFEADEIQLMYSIVLHGRAELGLAPDEYSGLVMVLLRILAFRPASADRAADRPLPGAPRVHRAAASSARVAETAVAVRHESPDQAARPAVAAAGPLAVASSAVAPDVVSAEAHPTPKPPAAAASMAAAIPQQPAVRVRPSMPEPPEWLDIPMEGEMRPAVAAAAAVDAASSESRPVQPARIEAAVTPSFVATPFGDRWADVVRQMSDSGSILAMARELALQSQCVAIEQDGEVAVWRIRVERETLRGTASCDKLQAALAQALARPVRLDTETGKTDDTPARRDALAKAVRQREAEQIIESDPLVLALMDQYKTARIVPGSIKPH